MAAPPAIALAHIDKRFGPVHANKDISLEIEKGTIHGIVGENGAGKSTLMSILFGFYQADSGEISVDGKPTPITRPTDAIKAGIGMVHQHFMLVGKFTVLENVVLGAEGGFILNQGLGKARRELERLEKDYGLQVDPDAQIDDLPVGLQQRVEILKALYRGAEVLILDEPTGVLTPSEAEHLFRILKQLKAQGKTIVLITHKLKEIMAVTDRVSVMRRGEMVATVETKATSPEELAELMVGRRVLLRVVKSERVPERTVLEVKNLVVTDSAGTVKVDDVSFIVRAGEIVGIAGVAGNGQSELLEAITGIRPRASGEILLNGKLLPCDAAEARAQKLAHVPEDRHRLGIVTSFDACENVILGYHGDEVYQKGLFQDRRAILADTAKKMEDFDVRPQDPYLRLGLFSGGNQQKIVLAREIEQDPDLLIVGQPTRGVDIGAIEFIHKRLIAMRDRGKAVLLVSVELDEIRGLADRVLVMCGGRITGECAPETPEKQIGLMMAGAAA
ncbi:ABC transporter ATP-binding protein [Taklimakanibacter deserti]|uniref:ABC transporter ATP-binding protein n=1 Tax=Taklimakanibacter deserti TaxID=2267839 RepID=UPI000E64A59F